MLGPNLPREGKLKPHEARTVPEGLRWGAGQIRCLGQPARRAKAKPPGGRSSERETAPGGLVPPVTGKEKHPDHKAQNPDRK